MHNSMGCQEGGEPIRVIQKYGKNCLSVLDKTVIFARSTEEEKQSQIKRLREFHERNSDHCEPSLEAVKQAINNGDNGFEALMEAVRHCSLGQLTDAFFEVGGQYRRNT